MGNAHGVATAITVVTPIRRGWTVWLRPAFLVGQYVKPVTGTLRKLSFIHFARWAIIKKIPYNGPPQEREHLNYAYLFFESNFNGTWAQYIDAFSHIVPGQMKVVWGSSFGFPGPVPVAPFKEYIRRNEYVANHYYCAYPEATTTMIAGALAVKRAAPELFEAAESASDEEFAGVYRRFLTRMQRHL